MRNSVKICIQILLFLFPWKLRRVLLNNFFSYKINSKAKIGFSVLLCDKLEMAENSSIAHLTICKNIDAIILNNNSGIGSLNFITGFNTKNKTVYSHRLNRKCELIIKEHSAITSRHFLDCNGGIYIGKYTTVAGIRSTFLTHSIDIYKNRQDIKPITIGDYCFIGTGCNLLGGSCLPDYSVLGAGAVLSKVYSESNFLYGGVPARPLKDLKGYDVAYFNRHNGFVK
ncbi:MAG: acyltransferase [Flavobacteriaceae bacterium]|nr:acyltransferase [Flavobacteriaceae bacterium]